MDIKLVGALAAGFAAATAMAQVNVGGVVGTTVGHSAAATGTAGATLDAGAATTPATGAVSDTARTTTRAANDATSERSVHVQAGARTQVARETRCYDDTGYYWDPYYSDGYYYCETRTTGPGAGVRAKVGG